MRGHYKIRRAAKEHRCTEASWHTIRKGDLYLSGAMPPEHEMSRTGKKWWLMKACVRCAKEYGLLCSDTREQLERMCQTTKSRIGPIAATH